jgi:hypothetical protein
MSDEKKRRSLAEIVRDLVHAGNHVDLKDDADALVNSEKAPEEEADNADQA